MQTFPVKNVLARTADILCKDDPRVPAELFTTLAEKPDLSEISVPLPARKDAYTCFARTDKALWMGANNGVTRYCANADRECDEVMFFSADRDLADSNVLAVFAEETADAENIWVLTETAVSHITLKEISAEEKALKLTEETQKYVDRHGMVTQRVLTVPRELSSRVPYGHSDNSGTFTAGYSIGEMCKYAVYKKKYGAKDERTKQARLSAMRAAEAVLLLMYIPGRGDGFVARTYLLPTEPVPDDGLFYRKENGRATCLPTSFAKKKGMAGKVIRADVPVPERLAHLYKDEGCDGEGIVYKGDTSSDEITLHYLHLYFAHEILGKEDAELDELIGNAAKNTLDFIISNDNELMECNGEPTTWAKWSESYFATPLGWSDGCLNAAELLMYHKVVMHITGEKGKWEENCNRLADERGYARLTALHDTRFFVSSGASGLDPVEDLMYGDHMLATAAYWMLIALEEDPRHKALYREGYKGWNGTFRREHNPAYDFPFMLACPDEKVNTEMLENWFRRQTSSRLCSSVSMSSRKDIAKRIRFGGSKETSWLLPPDESFISKYDRNPYDYTNCNNHEGIRVLESCYVYTFAYWFGRYYGIIEEE